MLLITFTINSTDYRISNEYHNLTHQWDRQVQSFTQVRYSTGRKYGGGVFPSFGKLILFPVLFDGDWPPPVSCPIKVQMTSSDEALATTLFEGTAHRESVALDGITYNLNQVDNSTVQTISFTGYLRDEFQTACTTLSLTLDYSRTTRAATLDTQYVPSGEDDLLSALSDLAAFFSHYFWIEDGTLYLADMLTDNGSTTLTEFDILPSTYKDNPPYTLFTGGNYHVDGSYDYGTEFSVSPVCHTTQSNIEGALGDIKTTIEKSQVVIKAPLELDSIPSIGQKVTLVDESLERSSTIEARIRAVVYDFDDYSYVLEGEGAIT